jgi:hypothetical protein
MKQTIEVIVSPTGDISINSLGFRGADCEKATQALEEALGAVSNRVKKPEYYSRSTAQNQQRLGRQHD